LKSFISDPSMFFYISLVNIICVFIIQRNWVKKYIYTKEYTKNITTMFQLLMKHLEFMLKASIESWGSWRNIQQLQLIFWKPY
jgi:hypothetical protein